MEDLKPTITFEPINDRVLVRRLMSEAVTRIGSIELPEEAIEKPQFAVVVDTGRGRILDNGTRVPLLVQPGDKVLLGKWSGAEVHLPGEEGLVILREDEILGIVRVSSVLS